MGLFNSLFGSKKSDQLSLEDREDQLEILKREIYEGVAENSSIKGIAAGLTGKELEEFVKKEKQEIREAYFREKRQ